MHGFEYQAAAHMIRHGFEAEGLAIVRGIRKRYDGVKRNPWNEMECGSNYARSMASYALLLVYSGFQFDMRRKRMGLVPMREGQYFWSVDGAWGTFRWAEGRAVLEVLYGGLALKEWALPSAASVREVHIDGDTPAFQAHSDALVFGETLRLEKGSRLTATY